jgi:hypothetical protein
LSYNSMTALECEGGSAMILVDLLNAE